jgi:hypothetical protein
MLCPELCPWSSSVSEYLECQSQSDPRFSHALTDTNDCLFPLLYLPLLFQCTFPYASLPPHSVTKKETSPKSSQNTAQEHRVQPRMLQILVYTKNLVAKQMNERTNLNNELSCGAQAECLRSFQLGINSAQHAKDEARCLSRTICEPAQLGSYKAVSQS